MSFRTKLLQLSCGGAALFVKISIKKYVDERKGPLSVV